MYIHKIPFIIRHMFRMSCFYNSLAFVPRSESGRFEQMWEREATFENSDFPKHLNHFKHEENDPSILNHLTL